MIVSAGMLLLALTQGRAEAQDVPPLSVELVLPGAVHVGDRLELTARITGAGEHAVLLTPRSEGTAVEVVRGRLMRSDARDPSADVLEMGVPIVARAVGAAVVRVEVAGYRCAPRCRLVEASAQVVLEVDRPPGTGAEKRAGRKQDAGSARTSSLSWVRLPGAESCVSSQALAASVEAQLERTVFVSASAADIAVEGRAERTEAGWRAVLNVADAEGRSLGERVVESAESTCEVLGQTVAVAVSVMIDPLTAPDPVEAAPPPNEPDPVAPHEPEVIVRTVRVEVPVEPSEEPSEEPADEPEPRWRLEIDATLVGAVGLTPTLSLGGMTSIILEPPDFIPVLVEGVLIPWSPANTPAGQADFLHFHAGLQLCPLALREGGLALHGCLGADAGGVIVVGGDLQVDEGERIIGQAHAVLRGHWDIIGPLTLRAGLHLLVPFRHDAFTVAGSAIYSPEPVAGMLDIGVGLHVP
ncbi:MAG: hypothetical protein AB8I08_04390 [Sandaracinaceae bacterium]